MKSKLLCLALVLSGDLFGFSTAPSGKSAGEKSWQATLRAAVAHRFFPPSGSVGIMFYTVPADAAKILESQPPAELLPFLAKLRMEPPTWKAGDVDEWIIIVRNGLHGRPEVITRTFTTAKGIISTNEIPVYVYADQFLQHAH